MKTIWLTSLGSSKDAVNKLMSQMKTYGLEIDGHFWKDEIATRILLNGARAYSRATKREIL